MKKKLITIFLLLTLFITGCVEVEILSDIRKDGTATVEIEMTITLSEEDWDEWQESEATSSDDLEDVKSIPGVANVELIEIDESTDGMRKRGTRTIIEIDDLNAYAEVFEKALDYNVTLEETDGEIEITFDYSSMEEADPDDLFGDDVDMQAFTRFNIEGTVIDHNATNVSGSTYEWDGNEMEDKLFIKFINEDAELISAPNDEIENEEDLEESNLEVNESALDDNIKLVLLGIVYSIVLLLGVYALVSTRKEL